MNRVLLLFTRYFVIASMSVALIIVGTPHAYANAIGAEPVKPIKFTVEVATGPASISKEIGLPAGLLFHEIVGKDRQIKRETAWYTVDVPAGILAVLKGKVCNWQIDFVYKANGREYMRERGKTIHECGGLFNLVRGQAKPKTLPKFGKACAELWVDGKFQAAQCHEIVHSWGIF